MYLCRFYSLCTAFLRLTSQTRDRFDIRHMPQGCGTWPAAWEVGDDWPNQGEVDIVSNP